MCDTDSGDTSCKKECKAYDYHYLAEDKVKCLIDKMPNASEVPLMTDSEYKSFLNTNGARLSKTESIDSTNDHPLNHIQEALINSVCSPNIVESIKQEFFRRLNKQS